MTNYINSIKGVSSRILFQEYPEIKMKLWKGHLWSTSYCVESQGNDEDTYKDNSSCKLCGW